MFLTTMDATNYQKDVSNFPSTRLILLNGQWYLKQANHGTYSNPGTLVGAGGGGGGVRNKDFGTVLQTDLTRNLVPSSAQAIG